MPSAMDGCRPIVTLAFCGALLCSCGRPREAPFPDWTDPAAAREASAGSSPYPEWAARAEELTKRYASRVHFTPAQRAAIVNVLSPLLNRLAQTRPRGSSIPFEARSPFAPAKGHRGYWILGEALAWRIEARARDGSLEAAVADTVAGTRFGFDLCGGGALEASLGLAIVDRVRLAILPSIRKLRAASLRRLSQGIAQSLENAPPLSATLARERLRMLEGVQAVQDAYRDDTLEILRKQLGASVADAIRYLEELRTKDPAERVAYFEGFAAEAETMIAHYGAQSRRNARQRSLASDPKLAEHRPWRRLARHFFSTPEPLFAVRDATIARTRLMGLQAATLAQIATTGRAPRDLSGTPSSSRTDPFSGLPMIYRADGREFRIYSVGADFRDDGGQTNDAFSAPDLTLESPGA